jgi:sporulation protein YlmC with PRC-barrel domain
MALNAGIAQTANIRPPSTLYKYKTENMERANESERLEELGGSDFKIADGQPNIKGWKVKDTRGQVLGEVEELIFDHTSQKVRYIVLELDGNRVELNSRKVLIPIGLAELHEDDDDVILPNVSDMQLQQLPEYAHEPVTPENESRIREIFSGAGGSADGGTGITSPEYYNHETLFRRRVKRMGGTTVIGIFDNGFDAQNTVNKLKARGFTDEQIDICVKDASTAGSEDYSVFTNFFTNLLDNKEQAAHYTEIARKGSVVTVHADSEEDAKHAAEILDQQGSLDMDRRSSPDQNGGSVTVGEMDQEAVRARLHSTIIGRPVSNEMRLRTDWKSGATGSGQ